MTEKKPEPTRRVVVLGPETRVLTALILVALAGILFLAHENATALALVSIVVSRAAPVEKGRPGDTVKMVRRGPHICPNCGWRPERKDKTNGEVHK